MLSQAKQADDVEGAWAKTVHLRELQQAEIIRELLTLRILGEHLEQEQHSVQLAGLRRGVQGRRAAVCGDCRVRACRQQLLHDLPAACTPPRTSSSSMPSHGVATGTRILPYPAPDCINVVLPIMQRTEPARIACSQ